MVRRHKRNPVVAAVLSLLVPGLGQIYGGRSERGIAILVAGIVIGFLALIWQTLYVTSGSPDQFLWPYRVSLGVYAAVFWVWQVVDGYEQAKVN